MKQYDFHPIANAFPLMEGDEAKEFRTDVKRNGVHEQGVLYEDKILDGRNRYLAAQLSGQEMSFRRFDPQIDGDSPCEFAISMNLRRRHLTTSQRAMVAAELATLAVGNPKFSEKNPITAKAVIGQHQAAKSLNVCVDSVQRAKKVRDHSPDSVVRAVKSGKVKVSDAAAVADQPKSVQAKALQAVQNGDARTMKAAVDELEPKHKSGRQAFDVRVFERMTKHLGHALPMIDAANKVHPAAKFHRNAMAHVKDAMQEVENWRKAVRR